MKELNINLKQAKELRKAISLAIQNMNCIEEEERFEELSKLYDMVEEIEDTLEEEESEME